MSRHVAPADRRHVVKRKTAWMIFGGAFVAVLAIVVVVVLATGGSSGSTAGGGSDLSGVSEVTAELKGIPVTDNVLGRPSAPVTVTEVIDPMCPACAQFSTDALPEFLKDQVRTGKVKMERILWPLPVHGTGAVEGSYASLAAGRQDKLWPYTEIFLRNQGDDLSYVTPEFLRQVAQAAGLDMTQFDADMNSKEELFGEKLFADKDLVEVEWGITATPGFRVTGPKGSRTLQGVDLAALNEAVAAVS